MNNNNDKRNRTDNEEDDLKIYGAPGSSLQTPEEHRHDEKVDPRKDNTMDVSNDDLRTSDIDEYREMIDGKRGDTEIDDTLSNSK